MGPVWDSATDEGICKCSVFACAHCIVKYLCVCLDVWIHDIYVLCEFPPECLVSWLLCNDVTSVSYVVCLLFGNCTHVVCV